MQQVIQIQTVPAGFPIGKPLRRVVEARERDPLRSRILRRVEYRCASFGVSKQHDGSRTFRHRRFAEQRAGAIGYRGRNRHADRIQIGQKPRFGVHIGIAPLAPARHSQDKARVIRRTDGKAVVEAALQQKAFQRFRQIVMGGNERRHGVGGRRGVGHPKHFRLGGGHGDDLITTRRRDQSGPCPTAHGTFKNPRKRARPPRTGSPFSVKPGNRARNREIAIAPSSRASAIPAH